MTVLRSGSATDVGRVRTINQDMPLERPNLFAVADGMGGHAGGEVAARVAVETLEQAFERSPSADGLRDAFSAANTAVWEQSQSDDDLRGMGTTLTAMALVGGPGGQDVLALANVGDSRAYLFSDGGVAQVTSDHSLAEERMRHGEMTEEEAAIHPQRHILTRALGVGAEVEADMWELELRTGDRVLLCSDGLSNEVSDDDMAAVLASVDDPGQAAQRLVDEANEHGGADNITVVVVDVQIGRDEQDGAARVTPLGLASAIAAATTATSRAAGEGLAAPSEPPTTAATESPPVSAAPPIAPDDTLALSVPAGLSEAAAPPEPGLSGEERTVGAGPVPVARTSSRVPPPPRVGPERPAEETRGQRRRRLGIPRRVTPRVIGFLLLVAAVPVAAYYALRWYAYDNWIVTLQGGQVVVEQGQRGGVLWFHPRVVDHTGLTVDRLNPSAVSPLKEGVQQGSLHAARYYVSTITVPTTTTTTATATTTTTTTTTPGGLRPVPAGVTSTTTTSVSAAP